MTGSAAPVFRCELGFGSPMLPVASCAVDNVTAGPWLLASLDGDCFHWRPAQQALAFHALFLSSGPFVMTRSRIIKPGTKQNVNPGSWPGARSNSYRGFAPHPKACAESAMALIIVSITPPTIRDTMPS